MRLISSRLIAGLLQTAIFFLLASLLPIAEFGSVNALVGIATFGVALCDLGVGTLLLKERSRDPTSGMIRTILRINAAGMGALLAILVLVYAAVFSEALPLAAAMMLLLWPLLERNSETWLAIAIADGRSWLTAAVVVVRRAIPLGAFWVLAGHADVDPLWSFGFAQLLGGFAGVAIVRVALRRSIPITDSESIRLTLRRALPFWFAVAASQSREMEIAAVQAAGGPMAAGAFAVASRALKPVQLAATSVAQVVLSQMSRQESASELRIVSLRILYFAIAGTILGLGLVPAVPPVIGIFLGSTYEASVLPVQAAIALVAPAALSSPLASALQASHHTRAVAVVSVIFAVAGLVGVAVAAILGGAPYAALIAGMVYAAKFVTLLFVAIRASSKR